MTIIDNLLEKELKRLKDTKTFKYETPLNGPQKGVVKVKNRDIIMLASNNYLGLSDHSAVKRAAIEGIKNYGYGVASVRFICGTQDIHLKLEKKISRFVGCEDTILFSSCFSANEGFFASITNEPLGYDEYQDIIYSDRLNHASIIDGQRLCRPERTVKRIYNHGDISHLEKMLVEDMDKPYRFRIIATDGVFSMEGDLAPLPELVDLARQYGALLFMDDSHGIGVCGKRGRGAAEELGVHGKIDVITGTLGKAIGGAAGGFISGSKVLIEYLRQKSRPYMFSNSLPASIIFGAMSSFDLLNRDHTLVKKLHSNTEYFRNGIQKLGFTIIEGSHPIVPVMLGEASLAMDTSAALLREGVYVKGLWFPVVPKGEARLRVQISAALSKRDIDTALEKFKKVGKKFRVI